MSDTVTFHRKSNDVDTARSSIMSSPLVPPTAEEIRLARRACKRNTANPAEEQMFLSMLGLVA